MQVRIQHALEIGVRPMFSREDWSRTRTWTLRVLEFGTVQGGAQLLNAITGLLIVRALSKEDYALFAIANSMQAACYLLAELGTGMGFQSIGGRVCDDRKRLGSLLNTTLRLRGQFAIVSFGICIPSAAWLLWKNGADGWMIAALCGVMAVGAAPVVSSSIFIMVPQLHGEFRRIQGLHLGSAALRFLLIGGLAFTWLNAVLATVVGALGNWSQVVFLRRWAWQRADSSAPLDTSDRREMFRLSIKSLPNTLFFCFQGQVTLLILTFLGSPAAIADITALGRFAALLAVFSAVFANVLLPRFSRCQDSKRLPGLYFLLAAAAVLVVAPFAVLSWVFPELLLWLLGEKYAALGTECGWVVTTGCVSLVLGTMWGLNYSKAWIRLQSIFFIPCVLGTQVIAALCLDLSNFHDVVIFGFATALSTLPVYLGDALLGLASARRQSAAMNP